jgi:hypothetical protein
MSVSTLEELRTQIDTRIGDLERSQKALKKPSSISFAERQSLTNRAGKALVELRAQREALAGAADGDEGAAKLIQQAEAAVSGADTVLNAIQAAQPAGLHRGPAARNLPGQQRRGASGPSQQRTPDRRGGD